MGDRDIISIEKFQEASQWTVWSFQVKVILTAAEIFGVVNGDDKIPTVTTDKDYAKNLADWKKNDAKAQKIIVTSIGQKVMIHILNCTTAQQMWEKLKSIYEQDNAASKHLLHQQFFSYEKSADDDVATHISKLESIAQKLKNMKVDISDDMLITKIMMTLPAEYRHFVSAWESSAEDQRTLRNLTNRLFVEENRIGMSKMSLVKQESNEAFLTKQSGGNNGALKRSVQHSKNKGKKKGNCFSCGSSEHWKNQCPAKKDESKSNDAKPTKSKAFLGVILNNESNDQALMSNALDEIDKRDAWYHDSGASSHMCKERSWFVNFTVLENGPDVTLANGDVMRATGKGDINILSFDGNKWIKKTMKGVLHSPKLFANLFSSTKAMDNGHEFHSNKVRCELLDEGCTVLVGVRDGSLYRMLIKVIKPSHTNDKSFANLAVKESSLRVWHERLGHQHLAHVRRFLNSNEIKFADENFDCDGCAYGKQHRLSFELRNEKSTACGEIIHVDVCGPMEVNTLQGRRYFVLFKDDFSHYRFVFFLKNKSEVVEKMGYVINMTEKQFGHPIKAIQTDNGTEFINEETNNLLQKRGIRHRRSVAYTPEQNGCIERENRTIMESARLMLHSKKLELSLWAEAVNTAVFILNRTGTSTVKEKTPYELWNGEPAKIDQFRIFGSEVYVHIPKQQRRKLDAKSKKCIFFGYENDMKGFRVMDESKAIRVVRDVKFLSEVPASVTFIDESDDSNGSTEADEDLQEGENNNDETEENASIRPAKIIQRRTTALTDVSQSNVLNSRLRSQSQDARNNGSVNMMALLASAELNCDEPSTYEEAMKSSDRDNWLIAMKDEIDSLERNDTWVLMEKPKSQKIVDSKWVYKVKRNTDDSIDRFRARVVARGFTQEYGVDYLETFSPVVRFASVRVILAIAAKLKLTLKQFDVKTAFLYGDLQEDIYVKQPSGFDDGSGRVFKLKKSLYGLKQSSKCWNDKFTKFIEKFGFTACKSDACVFISNKDGNFIILAIYVDDGLIAGSNQKVIDSVIEHLRDAFEVKAMPVECFLGFEIHRKEDGSIFINQAAYARKIQRKFEMEECNALAIPCDPNQILGKFEEAEQSTYPYRQLIGSLMYLSVGTRPDISFAVGYVSRYMERPTRVHVEAAKRILRYIKGTEQFGILYEGSGDGQLLGFSDSDYAGCVTTRKSTSGFTFLLDNGIVSWCSERQKSVSLSTMEAEYIAAASAIKELIWLKRLLNELLPDQFGNVEFFMDNASAENFVKNAQCSKRSKHIDVCYHFIRDEYNKKVFNLEHIPSQEMVADILTKPLARKRFEYLRSLMGVTLIKD